MKMTGESTSMMLFGSGGRSNSGSVAGGSASRPKSSSRVFAGKKRSRDDEDDDHRPAGRTSMMDSNDAELNVDMLDVDIDAFDWDRDMSPVKKKARPSQ